MTFNELNLSDKILKAIADTGYETPTPIQEQGIPPALDGRDILGIAQTGTGKTASFSLPMIHLLAKGRARARMPRSLVLCPTRELAAQVAENFETYSKHVKLSMALLIGGVSFADQDKKIDRGVDVLIATPGRLLDHVERGKLMLSGIEIMVVDEADRMLDMGFIPDIERIFKMTPFTRQTLFFSATMPPEITRLTQEFLSNPVRIEVARQATAAETVAQAQITVAAGRKDGLPKAKRAALRALLEAEKDGLKNAIIFCNRKRDVTVVHKSLKKHGYNAEALHGDLDQSIRTKTLDAFRDGKVTVLVASDVAARGLDIPAVSHVVNFDVPTHAEDYVHRIGRTGRAGRSGKAFTLTTKAEDKYIEAIEALIAKDIPKMDVQGAAVADRPKPAEKAEAPKKREAKASPKAEQKAAPKAEAKPQPQPQPKRDAPKRARGGRDDRGGAKVKGLGDHVPAFMLIPIPLKKKSAPKEDAVEKDAA